MRNFLVRIGGFYLSLCGLRLATSREVAHMTPWDKIRHSLCWLPAYGWQRIVRRPPRASPVHLIIALADHFEPGIALEAPGTYADRQEQERRLERWCREYPNLVQAWRDSDGRPFRHTYFFPAEQYDQALIDRLLEHCQAGWGEIEIQLHHGVDAPDTAESTRRLLVEFRDALARRGCLSQLDGVGPPRYAFVHGNSALANSANGCNCGVDDEMQILAETGCYADFTLASAPNPAQVGKINALYECALPLNQRAPHRRGWDLHRGRAPKIFPLIIQGPLMLDFSRRRGGWPVPSIENGALTAVTPATMARLRLWQQAMVTVRGRPDWIFIKLHCHGMDPRDKAAMLGAPMQQFLQELEEGARGGSEYRTHFVTAREMVNIALAACEGHEGNPADYRDHRFRPIARGSTERETKDVSRFEHALCLGPPALVGLSDHRATAPLRREELHPELQILVISYSFPPDGEVGGLRIARFCRYLPTYGIRPIVLTIQQQFHERRDDSFPTPIGLRIERTVRLLTPLDLYSRWKARAGSTPPPGDGRTPAKKARYGRALRRHVLTLLQTPDPYWGWYLSALRAAERLLEREPIAAILSTGPPWTPHLVARQLRKKYRVPWLADFRDPWAREPLQRELPAWRQRVDQLLEASCLRWADRVLCNTDRLRQAFVEFYTGLPTTKFVTLTNGFEDSVAAPAVVKPKRSTRLVLHIGSLYGGRRIDTFCEALATLIRVGSITPDSLKVVFLGDSDPAFKEAVREKTPQLIQNDYIEFEPRVSWQQAQQALWEADLLLLVQGEMEMQVPAKFYEYLATGKPIFAVVQEGALSDLVRSTGSGIWADPRDPATIAAKFLDVLELRPRPPKEVQQRWYDQYHCRSLTARLAGWFREVARSEDFDRTERRASAKMGQPGKPGQATF